MNYKQICFFLLASFAFISAALSKDKGDLWQQYLTSQDKWPPISSFAEQDITALPLAKVTEKSLVDLGEALFSFTGLSKTNEISCASCHRPGASFSDPSRVSVGINGRVGKRNSPSLLNVDLWDTLFWDSREHDLATQALEPLVHPDEMGSSPQFAVAKVKENTDLMALWIQSFPTEEVSWPRIAQALAEFQASLRGKETTFDAFFKAAIQSDENSAKNAFSDQQLLGLHVFRTKANCVACHNGTLFSDQKNHNTGLHYFGRKFEDLGVYNLSNNPNDMGKFRTPMLRHLMQTSPWMHNGLFDDLRGIIRMYAHGGARPRRPKDLPIMMAYPETTQILQPFTLSKEEEDALISFLKTL